MHGINEGASEDLVHDRNTVDLVAEHVGEDVVSWGAKERFDDLLGRLGLDLLVDDLDTVKDPSLCVHKCER